MGQVEGGKNKEKRTRIGVSQGWRGRKSFRVRSGIYVSAEKAVNPTWSRPYSNSGQLSERIPFARTRDSGSSRPHR